MNVQPTLQTIMELFPHPTLTRVHGMPTYQDIAILKMQLSANAVTASSTLGNGELGHLGLVIGATEYDTIVDPTGANAAIHWSIPTMPDTPEFDTKTTQVMMQNELAQYNEDTKDFQKYCAVHAALRAQLLEAINPVYLAPLKSRIHGFANTTLRQLIKHLETNYAKLSRQDIIDNDQAMMEPYDPSSPFENLVEQIELAEDIAEAAGVPNPSNRR